MDSSVAGSPYYAHHSGSYKGDKKKLVKQTVIDVKKM